jgi:hypothetical protein
MDSLTGSSLAARGLNAKLGRIIDDIADSQIRMACVEESLAGKQRWIERRIDQYAANPHPEPLNDFGVAAK